MSHSVLAESVFPESMNHFSTKFMVKRAWEGCVMHDTSYESWYSIKGPTVEDLRQVLNALFDPIVSLKTDLSGCRFLMYEFEQFPMGCLGPVRLVVVSELEIHLAVSECIRVMAEDSLGKAIENSVCCFAKLPIAYSILLVGKGATQILQTWKTNTPPQSFYLGDDSVNSECHFRERFVNTSPPGECESVAPHQELHFQLGLKKHRTLEACLLLFPDPSNAQAVWKKLASTCGGLVLGHHDMEKLMTFLHLPSFPRDYLETEVCCAYWKAKHDGTHQAEYFPEMLMFDRFENRVVPREWHYIQDFFSGEQMGENMDHVFLPVVLRGPTRKLGWRFSDMCDVLLPTNDDYEAFLRRKLPASPESREVIGTITSSWLDSHGNHGVGVVSAQGFLRLQHACASRRYQKRKLFVLVRKNESIGCAFLSVQSRSSTEQ